MSVLTEIAATFSSTELPVVTSAVEITQLCQANPNRYAVGFFLSLGNGHFITSAPGQPANCGFACLGVHIDWFYAKDVGPLAFAAWWARPNGLAGQITVWEVILNRG